MCFIFISLFPHTKQFCEVVFIISILLTRKCTPGPRVGNSRAQFWTQRCLSAVSLICISWNLLWRQRSRRRKCTGKCSGATSVGRGRSCTVVQPPWPPQRPSGRELCPSLLEPLEARGGRLTSPFTERAVLRCRLPRSGCDFGQSTSLQPKAISRKGLSWRAVSSQHSQQLGA